jgi:hypothetical protein
MSLPRTTVFIHRSLWRLRLQPEGAITTYLSFSARNERLVLHTTCSFSRLRLRLREADREIRCSVLLFLKSGPALHPRWLLPAFAAPLARHFPGERTALRARLRVFARQNVSHWPIAP